MYIEIPELKSAIYAYQIEQITEADDDIVYMALSSAEDEAKSYLRPNGKGLAPAYDVAAIFGATGSTRNAMLMQIVKTLAVWNVVQLCNVDMLFENMKDRYDRAITWLKDVNRGNVILDLPRLTAEALPLDTQAFRSGSRPKFIHE